MTVMENEATHQTDEANRATGKPVLEPLWTDHRSLSNHPETSPLLPSPSLLPSPLHPLTSRIEPRTPYEQAMIHSLDQQSSLSSPSTPVTLTSIMEQLRELSIDIRHGLPSPPRTPRTPVRERRYLIDRAKSISYYGNVEIFRINRRHSHQVERRRTPAKPEPLYRSVALADPSQLRQWGQVYFGHLKSADVLIIPKSLAVKQEENSSPPNLQAIVVPRAENVHAFVLKENDKGRFSAEQTPFRLDYEALSRQKRRPFPIHLMYALQHLPLLAEFLESGHVHRRDIMYLPIPHASAWVQTLRYVYIGEGEVTEKMRKNIVYLGGKV